MPKCIMIEKCSFFNDKMENMPVIAEQMKKKYCQNDNSQCARYIVLQALGKEKVPANLTPNQFDKAKEIIGSCQP